MANTIQDAYKAEVRRSHALLKPISKEAAAIFYPTLFELDPSAKPLFKNVDMDKQGVKLMKILGVAVLNLDKMDQFKPMLETLGKKHVSYGVKEEMYPSVVSALLITLDKGLGKECHPETKAAWKWVMTSISAICIAAAREQEGVAPMPLADLTAIVSAAVTDTQSVSSSARNAFGIRADIALWPVVALVAVASGFVALMTR